MIAAPIACAVCGQPSVHGGRRCAAHVTVETPRVYSNEHDEMWHKFYNTTRWRKFRQWMIRRNPICQRLIRGEQCHEAAVICHHLRGLKVHPEDFTDGRQVCLLCRQHHPDSEGTPDWVSGKDYVPTVV